mmetsp:Transcript_134555/g.287899  ORF Transcript_134555/g.287899 Transcript_134555/m.287899 type:complete len:312 (+) Transcript_134555:290-1225(+)
MLALALSSHHGRHRRHIEIVGCCSHRHGHHGHNDRTHIAIRRGHDHVPNWLGWCRGHTRVRRAVPVCLRLLLPVLPSPSLPLQVRRLRIILPARANSTWCLKMGVVPGQGRGHRCRALPSGPLRQIRHVISRVLIISLVGAVRGTSVMVAASAVQADSGAHHLTCARAELVHGVSVPAERAQAALAIAEIPAHRGPVDAFRTPELIAVVRKGAISHATALAGAHQFTTELGLPEIRWVDELGIAVGVRACVASQAAASLPEGADLGLVEALLNAWAVRLKRRGRLSRGLGLDGLATAFASCHVTSTLEAAT